MADATVLGMPLDVADDDPAKTGQPLGAVVVAKVLGDDGEIYYLGNATDGIKSVEALGMLRYGLMKLERRMMADEDGSE